MEKSLLIEQIVNKIREEYSEYLVAFKNQDKQYVLRHCYEYICKKDIASGIETLGVELLQDLSEQRLHEILSCSCILDWLYDFWLKYDDSTADEMKNCVKDTFSSRTVPIPSTNHFG